MTHRQIISKIEELGIDINDSIKITKWRSSGYNQVTLNFSSIEAKSKVEGIMLKNKLPLHTSSKEYFKKQYISFSQYTFRTNETKIISE